MLAVRNEPRVAETPKSALTDTERHALIKEWESYSTSSGRTHQLRHLRGEKLTYREAGLAKCAECCCGYADGRHDCEIPACPLYQFMPYKGKSEGVSTEPEQ